MSCEPFSPLADRPWRVANEPRRGLTIESVPMNVRVCERISTNANASHIVRCVNAHDELVAALREIAGEMIENGNEPALRLQFVARAALAKVTA